MVPTNVRYNFSVSGYSTSGTISTIFTQAFFIIISKVTITLNLMFLSVLSLVIFFQTFKRKPSTLDCGHNYEDLTAVIVILNLIATIKYR